MNQLSNIVNLQERRNIVKVDIDNGYDKVARELIDVLANPPVKLSAREFRFLFAVISKTYRFKKRVDWISSAQLSDITGIAITNISKVKTLLIDKKVLVLEGKKIGINTSISEWENSQKRLITKMTKQSKTTREKSKTTREKSKTTLKTVENDNNIRESINTLENNTIEYCSEQEISKQKSQIFISLPLNSKSEFHAVNLEDVKSKKLTYPNANVEIEYRKMLDWLNANPKRRKTKSGIAKFISGWMSKAHDKPGNRIQNISDDQNFDVEFNKPTWMRA